MDVELGLIMILKPMLAFFIFLFLVTVEKKSPLYNAVKVPAKNRNLDRWLRARCLTTWLSL